MLKFIPTAENYRRYRGQKMRCGNSIVKVTIYRTESRSGSWERGFRFSSSSWGVMKRVSDGSISMDHGKTWHSNLKAASKSKGKLRLESESHGELAFEGIQQINRYYYGPGYKWSR